MKIVQDVLQFFLYLLWLAVDSLPVHSCNAWTKDGEGIGDVGEFDRVVFIVLFLTISTNCASVGWPVMAWALWVAMASLTSCLVKPL